MDEMNADHEPWLGTEDGRDVWECSCGMSGSAPEGRGDIAAERHIRPDESTVYTSRRP
jgi:hypothetical protein